MKKPHTIKYHNAIDDSGKLININEVTPENRTKHYFCIGCGGEMSAVLGSKREHHFRHKGTCCNWESYLHKLSKKLIKEKFENQKEFIIKPSCSNANNCRLKQLNTNIKCDICDLKKLYDTCEEEKTYNGYRADLMLSNSKDKDLKPFFIEISVSHDCEDNKISSGIQIMEIKITDEYILAYINKAPILFNNLYYNNQPFIRFYNLGPLLLLDHFWVTKDNEGVLRCYLIPNGTTCKFEHRNDSIYEIAIPSCQDITLNDDKIDIFTFCILKAIDSGINIKHCNLCTIRCQKTASINKTTDNGEIIPQVLPIKNIPDQYIDKYKFASKCKFYYSYHQRLTIKNIYFIEWHPRI